MNLSPTLHFSALADMFLPPGFKHLNPPQTALYKSYITRKDQYYWWNLLAADLSIGAISRLGTGSVRPTLVWTLGRVLLVWLLEQGAHILTGQQRLLTLSKYRGDGGGEGHVQHVRHGLGQVVGIHSLVVNQSIQRSQVFPAVTFRL